MFSEDEYLMLSALQHYYFCPRQCALIHLEQSWAENYHTMAGNIMHEHIHSDIHESRKDIMKISSLRLFSKEFGIVGSSDLVEFHKSAYGVKIPGRNGLWNVVPIEYKKGKEKKDSVDKVQLCSQAICLEEMLKTKIEKGFLFYGTSHRRVEVEFSEDLRVVTCRTIENIHKLFKSEKTPLGKYSKKCNSCSFFDMCMPKSAGKGKSVKLYLKKYIEDYS